jgi:hypothetical protein
MMKRKYSINLSRLLLASHSPKSIQNRSMSSLLINFVTPLMESLYTVEYFSDNEYDDVESEILDNIEVCEDPIKYVIPANILNLPYDGDKTPTREREETLTVKELQIAAKKLNLCLVTPASMEEQ